MDRFRSADVHEEIYDRVDLMLYHAVPLSRIGPEVVHALQRLVVDPRGLGRCIHSLLGSVVAPQEYKADESHPAAWRI
jgi:hypothetical protein